MLPTYRIDPTCMELSASESPVTRRMRFIEADSTMLYSTILLAEHAEAAGEQ